MKPKLQEEEKKVLPQVKPEPIEVEVAQQKVIFEPNPGPQTEFLSSNEREVLYVEKDIISKIDIDTLLFTN
mgnify:CR=1 FL=1